MPRGVFRHRSGFWAVRFTCGAGHIHEEMVGPIKSDAISAYYKRRDRSRATDTPAWCPAVERRRARDQARAEQQAERERERRRVTFRQYAVDYFAWSTSVHRAQRTAKYEVNRLISLLGDTQLDSITPAHVERCVRTLGETLASASVNRLRDRLSGMFKRARRLCLVSVNPVTEIPKLKEAGRRLAFLSPVGEGALLAALPPARPLSRSWPSTRVSGGPNRQACGGRTWTR